MGTGKWGGRKKGKNFQLGPANVNSSFYTCTVSRRGQPAGRSNSAEVIEKPLRISLLHVSTEVHVTRMHVQMSTSSFKRPETAHV